MDRNPFQRHAAGASAPPKRAAVAYAGAGTEPTMAELLDDPITRTLMASDRIRPEDVGALVEDARRRLIARRSHPTP